MISKVGYWCRQKSYGFLLPDKEPDLFCHRRALVGRTYLEPGAIVSYERGVFNGKPVAVNVLVIEEAPTVEPDKNGIETVQSILAESLVKS